MAISPRGKNTLVQRIALDGGNDIRRELEALGDDGKRAFEALERAANEASKATTDFGRWAQSVRRDVVQLQNALLPVANSLGQVVDASMRVVRNFTAIGVAAAGAVGAVVAFTKAAADTADAQGDAAAALGISIEEYGRLQYAFQQNGADATVFNTAMTRLNVRMREAAQGVGEGAALFEELGVNVLTASGELRPAEQVLLDVADAFQRIPPGAQRSALAVDLFGRSGARAVQALSIGATAFRAFGDEAERTGAVITGEAFEALGAFNDAADALGATLDGLRVQIGIIFAPTLVAGIEAFIALIVENREQILAFATAIGAAVLPVLEDLVRLISGEQVQAQWLLDLINTVGELARAFNTLAGIVGFVFGAIENAVQMVLDPINMLFGTELEARQVIFIALLGQVLGVFRLIGAAISAVGAIWTALVTIGGNATAALVANVAGLVVAFGAFEELLESVYGWLKDIVDWAVRAAKALFGVQDAAGGGAAGTPAPTPAFAAGGAVRGPGTGTSDSIWARLSNGEFVIKARAVRQYGASFFHALNNMRLPAFANGGLVGGGLSMSVPAFANGGAVTKATTPFNLQIGGEVFNDLLAPEDVADKMVRFATGRQTKQAGRLPSWYK